MALTIQEINFQECVKYWKEVNHFNDPNKIYNENVKKLGPFKQTIENPKFKCYGLFDDYLIGVTQLIEWDISTIRFRTINIRKEWRQKELGAFLLQEAYEKDWSNYLKMFGWMNLKKIDWALKFGFKIIENSEHDNHVGIIKEM